MDAISGCAQWHPCSFAEIEQLRLRETQQILGSLICLDTTKCNIVTNFESHLRNNILARSNPILITNTMGENMILEDYTIDPNVHALYLRIKSFKLIEIVCYFYIYYNDGKKNYERVQLDTQSKNLITCILVPREIFGYEGTALRVTIFINLK